MRQHALRERHKSHGLARFDRYGRERGAWIDATAVEAMRVLSSNQQSFVTEYSSLLNAGERLYVVEYFGDELDYWRPTLPSNKM
jgi:hypothetical protein